MKGALKTFFDKGNSSEPPIFIPSSYIIRNCRTEVVKEILQKIDRWDYLGDHEAETQLWEELREYSDFMSKRQKSKEFPPLAEK